MIATILKNTAAQVDNNGFKGELGTLSHLTETEIRAVMNSLAPAKILDRQRLAFRLDS